MISLTASSRTESLGTMMVSLRFSPRRKRAMRSLTEIWRQLTITLDAGFVETVTPYVCSMPMTSISEGFHCCPLA